MLDILLNERVSKNSVNVENSMMVELKGNTKLLPTTSVSDIVNLYEQFEKERKESDTYRLMFTINPICTNVLFNTLTEIVKDEGSDNPTVLESYVAGRSKLVTINEATNNNCSIDTGGSNGITRAQAVRNTEYSNKKCGFEYHCGYDIFNNHTLRSITFKSVCPLNGGNNESKRVYNTLQDHLRQDNGNSLMYDYRINEQEIQSTEQHLYEYEDVTDFFSSISDNLIEKDGWFGFTNVMKVGTSASPSQDDCINKTINSKEPCEFIDMYPDRTLFSFVPKVNPYRKRIEKNWHYCLTYPYSSTKDHILVNQLGNDGALEDDGTHFYNGLLITSITQGRSYTGQEVAYVRTACRHNLNKNDKFILINSLDNTQVGGVFSVVNVGDLNQEDKEHVFYINLNEINLYVNFNASTNLAEGSFRFRKQINGYDCEYYIRIFRKLPNFKFAKEKLSSDTNYTDEQMEQILKENTIDFDNSLYQMGFARNIYSDDEAQVTFTDDIHINNLKDNLGRPLTEIFLTIIKNNSGYREWYGLKDNNYTSDYGNENVEYSHCFGEVTSGFDLPSDATDRTYSNVHNLNNIDTKQSSAAVPLEREIALSGTSLGESLFYGDIVEYNSIQALETVIEPVCYRFNTAQRETSNPKYTFYEYDTMLADDYDVARSTSTQYTANAGFLVERTEVRDNPNQRPEGYYYKAHYRIPLRSFGDSIQQNTATGITYDPTKVTIDGGNGSSRYVITSKTISYVEPGEYLLVTQLVDGKELEPVYCKVLEVRDLVTFVLNCPYYNLTTTTNPYILRRRNYTIPTYATSLMDGTGRYIWREVYPNGDNTDSDMVEYPFANGAFYIHQNLNFFLLRQDPFNEYQQRAVSQQPADQAGNSNDISNYEYFAEEEKIC